MSENTFSPMPGKDLWVCDCGTPHYLNPGTKGYHCVFCGQDKDDPETPEQSASHAAPSPASPKKPAPASQAAIEAPSKTVGITDAGTGAN